MTSAIEERVVEMKFNNQEFERNVDTSINTIDKLKAALDFRGAAKGMDEISKAADKVDMSNIVSGIEAVKVKFDALQVAGFTVVQELTKAFLGFGKKLWDISFGQMKSGGMSRALKIEQANFKMKALLKNMDGIGDAEDKIKAKMDEIGDSIDRAVTGTAYGYDAAANVAAQLMASGMTDASKMYDYLRGIAGAAAMTGRSFEDIGQIFTTISSNGKLMTMQLRQFSSAGLNISAELAQQMGKTEQQINEMVTRGEISFQQFAQAMYDAFGESAGKADETYAGVTTNIKAQLSRIGQVFAEPYIQNMIPALQKLKAMLVSLKNALIPVGKRFDRLMHVVSGWLSTLFESVDFSRLDNFLRGIENIFWGVILIFNSVREAFVEMFPKKTLDELNAAAISFERFTEAILPTEEGLEGIKNIVKALLVPVQFFIKKIEKFKQALQPVIIALFQLVWTLLSLLGHIGNIIVVLTEGIRASDGFNAIFTMIGYTVASVIIVFQQFFAILDEIIREFNKSDTGNGFMALIKDIGNLITNVICFGLALVMALMQKIISIINVENVRKLINGIGGLLAFIVNGIQFVFLSIINGLRVLAQTDSILGKLYDLIKKIFGLFTGFFKGENATDNINKIKDAFGALKDKLREVGDAIKAFLGDFDVRNLMFFAFAASIIALIFTFTRLLSSLNNLVFQTSGLMKNIRLFSGALNRIRQTAQYAKTFIFFAGSILMIVGALYTLSEIPTDKLIPAAITLGAFAVAMITFAALMVIASKNLRMLPSESGAITAIGVFLLGISGSLVLLAVAIKILVDINMSAKQALSAIGTIVAIMISLSAATGIMYGFAHENLNKGTLSFIAFALACDILVKTMARFSQSEIELSLNNILFIIGTIVAIGTAMAISGSISFGSSFVVLAYAVLLKTILSAFLDIATMPIDVIKEGLQRIYDAFNILFPLILLAGVANRIAGGIGAIPSITGLILSITVFLWVAVNAIKSIAKMDDISKLEEARKTIEGLVWTISICFSVILAVVGFFTTMLTKNTYLPINALQMGKLKIVQSGIAIKGIAAMIISLSLSVAILAVAVKMLAKAEIDPKELNKAVVTISGIMLVLGALVAGLMIASAFTRWSNVGTVIVSVMSLIFIVLGIFSAVALLGTITPERLTVITGIMPWILGVLGILTVMFGAIALMSKWSKKEALGMPGRDSIVIEWIAKSLAMVAGIALLFGMLKVYMENIDKIKSWQQFIPLLAVLGSFVLILIVLGVTIEKSKKQLEATYGNIKSSDILRLTYATGMIILLYATVLATVAALVYIAKDMPNDQAKRVAALAIGIGAIMAGLIAMYVLMAYALDAMPEDVLGNKLNNVLKMGGALAIMASIFIILSATAAILAHSLVGTDPDVLLPVLASLVAILGGLAIIIAIIAQSPIKFDNKKIFTFVGAVGALSLILIAISGAMRLMPTGGKRLVNAFVVLAGSIFGLCALLEIINDNVIDFNVENILSFVAGMAALTLVLINISYAISILKDMNESTLWSAFSAITILLAVITGLAGLMVLVTKDATFMSSAGMFSAAAAIAAFAVAISSIATALATLSQASKDLSPEQLDSLRVMIEKLLGVMALFLVAGGVIGALTGGISAAVILATGVAFLTMGATLYYAATGINEFTDAVIKMMDSGVDFAFIVDQFVDGAKELAARSVDFATAVFTIIATISATIIGGAGMIAASITMVLAHIVAYLLVALLVMLSPLESGLAAIASQLKDWIENGDGWNTFYNLGYAIGGAVTAGIIGAFAGLTQKIREVIFDETADLDFNANQNEYRTSGRSAGEYYTKSTLNPILALNPSAIAGYNSDYKWNGGKYNNLIQASQEAITMTENIAKFNDELANGEVHLDNVLRDLDSYEEVQGKIANSWSAMSYEFRNTGDNLHIRDSLISELNQTAVLQEITNNLKTAYDSDVITLEQYEDALIQIANSIDSITAMTKLPGKEVYASMGEMIEDTTIPESSRREYERLLRDYNGWLGIIGEQYKEAGGNLEKLVSQTKTMNSRESQLKLFGGAGINSDSLFYEGASTTGVQEMGANAANAYADGFEQTMEFRLSGGHGGHGVQGMTRLIPVAKTSEVKDIAQQHGKVYKDNFIDNATDNLGEDLAGAVNDSSTDSAWDNAGKDFYDEVMGALHELGEMVGIPDIPIDFDLTSAEGISSLLRAMIPEEVLVKVGLEVDTSSQEYLDLITYANQNLGGQARWERETYGNMEHYTSADDYARRQMGFTGDITEGFKRAAEALGIGIPDLGEEAAKLKDEINSAAGSIGDYSDEAGKAAKETDHLADSVENALDIFSEFNVELDMTAKDVLKNFSSQLIGVSGWSQELQALAGRGISQAVLEDLADAGPQAYDRVHALYTATASQLALFNKMYEQKLSLEKSTVNDIRASFTKNGAVIVDAAEQVAESATEKVAEVQEQVLESAQIGVNEIEQGVIDAHKIGMEYEYINGVVIPNSIKDSIQKATPSVAAIFGEMGYQSMEAFKHYLNVEDAITMVEGFQETLKDSITSSLSIFDEVKEKEDISAEEMLNRMKENVKNVGKWANDLQSLAARGIDEGLLAQLQALGPEGADKVHAFTLMTDAQLRAANNAFGASAALPQQVADRITKSYAEAGYNTILGFVEGIDPTAAEEVMTALGTYSLAALEQALDINSPSEKTKKDGLYSVEGFCLGIEENLGAVAGSAVLMAETFCSVLEESMTNYFAQKKMNGYDPTGIMSLDQVVQNDPGYLSGLKEDTTEMNSRRLQSVQVNVVPVLDNAKVIETVDNVKKMFDISKFNLMPTIGLAQATTAPMSQNRDYSPALKDISTALHSEKDEISAMRNDISMLQVAMAGMQVTLDGATVGKLMTPYVNKNLGVTYSRDKRRKF